VPARRRSRAGRSAAALRGRRAGAGGAAYRRRHPIGVIYGHQNRYTELRIQLKADGQLANVGVGLPSGLEFLDDEAITAFKDAQPFPNPPHQLLERDGLITFHFGFL
jgi:TonB family protein